MNLELKEPLSLLLLVALQGTVILALAAVATLLLRRAAAALRHLVWGLAVFGLLAAPVLSALLPRWEVPLASLQRSAATELVPEIYLQKPPTADTANAARAAVGREPGAPVVGSSLVCGTVLALLLNGLFRIGLRQRAALTIEPCTQLRW